MKAPTFPFSQRQLNCLILAAGGVKRGMGTKILNISYGAFHCAYDQAQVKLTSLFFHAQEYNYTELLQKLSKQYSLSVSEIETGLKQLLENALEVPQIKAILADSSVDTFLKLLYQYYRMLLEKYQ